MPVPVNDVWMVRAKIGGRHAIVMSEAMFEGLIGENATPNVTITSEWVNAPGNRDQLPIALVLQLLEGASPLKTFREFRGLSQAELAKAAALAPSEIDALENGAAEDSLDVRRKLARVLEVTLDDLEGPRPLVNDL